ncbi:MAG: diguanylate cyclase [Phycisphaerae bacterium]|nr:diguanylate cyclase [Phycisphaerae bacterium]
MSARSRDRFLIGQGFTSWGIPPFASGDFNPTGLFSRFNGRNGILCRAQWAVGEPISPGAGIFRASPGGSTVTNDSSLWNPNEGTAALFPEFPKSARVASQLANLDAFLGQVALGFHWDLLDRINSGIYFVDGDRRIRYWSRGAERITGFSAETVLGRCCRDGILRHIDNKGTCLCDDHCPLEAVMRDGNPRSADVFLHHRQGHRVPVHVHGVPIRDLQGRIIGALETFSDTTARSADLERIQALEVAALIDPITGLANRRFFETELSTRLTRLRDGGPGFALLIMDIDHFKEINDGLGHPVGDEVLSLVGRTLSHACRSHDFAARFGGDEFAALCTAAQESDVQERGEFFRQLVGHSQIVCNGKTVSATLSVGGTLARVDDDSATLLARADQFLYLSKRGGRNRTSCQSDDLSEVSRESK